MFNLLMMGLALFGLYKLAGNSQAGASFKKIVGIGPVPTWPKLSNLAMQGNQHYFFALPFASTPDPKQLATALTAMGFDGVQVFPKGKGTDGAPSPNPPDWAANSTSVLATGRWMGAPGAVLDAGPLIPLGFDTQSHPSLWMALEDWLKMHSKPA